MNDTPGPGSQEEYAAKPELHAQAQLLRARVEGELGKPAIVMVTSARPGDGKSLTAYSLARCFANEGHRVALVTSTREEYQGLALVELREEQNRMSHDQLAAFVEKMRSEHDFTIIDAETFANSNAMALSRLVDGILLAVRIGRAPTAEDELMVGLIEQMGGRVVGVVATEADAIDDFERARRTKPASTRPRALRAKKDSAAAALALAAVLMLTFQFFLERLG